MEAVKLLKFCRGRSVFVVSFNARVEWHVLGDTAAAGAAPF